MAALLKAGMPGRGWSEGEIAELLGSPGAFAVTSKHGFALGRAVAGEAELLTVVVDPAHRRSGDGRRLLAAFEAGAAARGATAAFLEVAADNGAARGLYEGAGYSVTGRRRAYYARPGGPVDAILMTKTLSPRS